MPEHQKMILKKLMLFFAFTMCVNAIAQQKNEVEKLDKNDLISLYESTLYSDISSAQGNDAIIKSFLCNSFFIFNCPLEI